MTSGEGDLAAEVLRYLQRFQSIDLVIVDSLLALQRCLDAQRMAPYPDEQCSISLTSSLAGM
jgi:RecA/RadA recombinase